MELIAQYFLPLPYVFKDRAASIRFLGLFIFVAYNLTVRITS